METHLLGVFVPYFSRVLSLLYLSDCCMYDVSSFQIANASRSQLTISLESTTGLFEKAMFTYRPYTKRSQDPYTTTLQDLMLVPLSPGWLQLPLSSPVFRVV
jgi:hypothetical protein